MMATSRARMETALDSKNSVWNTSATEWQYIPDAVVYVGSPHRETYA